MVRSAHMLHQRLLLGSALSVVACAQIAGFEQLSSPTIDDLQGGSDAGVAGKASAGGGGAFAGTGHVAGSTGEGASAGMSRAGSGGKVGGGGSTPTAGGATANGGTPGATAGAGGAVAGAGGSSTAGAGGSTAGAGGAAGAPVIGGCNAELLKNSGFDAGPVDWLLDSNGPGIDELSDVINKGTNQASIMANITPRAGGLYFASLGGVLDGDKGSHVAITQDVQIPAKVSRLILSGWIQIRTTEPGATNDQIDIAIYDAVGPLYRSFKFWNATEVTSAWKSFNFPVTDGAILNELRGRTLTFIAEAQADTEYVSTYWLDSLSLFAECP
jgi:hypothetical protein